MVMADTSREFQEENEITKFGDNIGVGQFFLYKQRLKCWKVHQNWWKFVWIVNIFYYFFHKLKQRFSRAGKWQLKWWIIHQLSMIHKKIQEKNHQNWWTYIDWKVAAKLGKNQSPKTVKISMNPQNFLQKCH